MVKIARVPPHLLEAFWPKFAPMVFDGLKAAYDVNPAMCISKLFSGHIRLWAVTENGKTKACFMTKRDEDDRGAVLTLFALTGSDPKQWASTIDSEVTAYTKLLGLSRWRFWGSKAWARLNPNAHFAMGNEIDGQAAFERAVK